MPFPRFVLPVVFAFIFSSHAAFSVLSHSEGEVVVRCFYENSNDDETTVSVTDLSTEFDAQVESDSRVLLPAQLLHIAADSTVLLHVSVTGENPVPLRGKLAEGSGGDDYPRLQTTHVSTIGRKLFSGVPVQSVRITPLFERAGEWYLYSSMIVTIRYTPLRGAPLRKHSALKQRLAAIVLNPTELVQPRITKGGWAPRATVDITTGPSMTFTITNGASRNDDRETKVEHSCNGLYALRPDDIAYLGRNLPIGQIALYASDRNLSEAVPALDSLPEGLVPISRHCDDRNGDGLFNGDDKIIFYGSSMHGWYWDTEKAEWDFSFNIYDHKRVYWVTLQRGMASPQHKNIPGGKATAVGVKLRRTQQTRSLNTPNDSYSGHSSRFWKWCSMTGNVPLFSQPLEVFDPVPNSAVEIRVRNVKKRGGTIYASLNKGEEKLTFKERQSQWVVGDAEALSFQCRGDFSGGDYMDIASFDTRYRRNLSMQGISQPLHFYSDTLPEVKEYTIRNLPQEPVWCFRLDEQKNEAAFITEQTGGAVTFSDSSGVGFEYIFTPESELKWVEPQAVNTLQVGRVTSHIRSVQGEYRYVIVTSPELLPYADSFAGMKEKEGFSTLLLSTDDIYREFSGGAATPVAIRNAMIYLRDRSPSLTYLLLFGSGHYDYKGLTTAETNHIFPFLDGDTVIEDFYGLLDKGEKCNSDYGGADLLIGRVPAISGQQASAYLAKYREVMAPDGAERGWRNRFVLSNDDGAQGESKDNMKHAHSSDSLFAILMTNRSDMDIASVNLLEYQYKGSKKPDAHRVLFEELNKGCAFANYYGHGSYHTVSDEGLLLFDDLPTLKNRGAYPVFSFFSCAVGFFDMPDRGDIGSELVTIEEKGAIATWVSSRSSSNPTNKEAAKRMYRAIFADSVTMAPLGIGTFAAKEKNANRKYVLFGDPSYRPYVQREVLPFHVGKRVGMSLEAGVSFQIFDTLWLTASVPPEFDGGGVSLQIQNPTRYGERTKDGDKLGNLKKVEYSLPGTIIYDYQGELPTGEPFVHAVRIPRSVQEGSDSVAVKLSYHKDGRIASGVVDTIGIHGINLQNIDTTDKVGPMVKCRVRYREGDSLSSYAEGGPTLIIDGFSVKTQTVVDGDTEETTTYASVTLDIECTDESGIDHYSQNAGEGLSVSIDGVLPLRMVNDLYQPVDGDGSGTIPLVLRRSQFPGKGSYAMRVQATDQLGNRTIEKYTLKVTSMGDEEYTMGTLFAYPCPVSRRGATRFWFNQFTDGVLQSVLKIYTLDGRLIRSIRGVESGYEWDLRDQKGNLLSPNIYLYRLFVECDSRENNMGNVEKRVLKSPIKKITILP